jgi:hypothetical protein
MLLELPLLVMNLNSTLALEFSTVSRHVLSDEPKQHLVELEGGGRKGASKSAGTFVSLRHGVHEKLA